MANIKGNITLEEFQRGKIDFPFEEYIYYIENPLFYSRWENIIKTPGIRQFLIKCFDMVNSWGKEKPAGKNILFLGHSNRSFNSNQNIIDNLKSTKKLSKKNSVLVIGKGDYEIDDEVLKNLPASVKCLFANNINTASPLTKYLPMGRDFRSRSLFSEIGPEYDKERLCYCNFSVNTHPQRKFLYEKIKKIPKFEDIELS